MESNLNAFEEKKTVNVNHGENIILRLTYISRYNTKNANIEVTRILEQARRNNERKGITGVLVMNENYFLQVIEGARPVINNLLRKLVNDERHFDLEVIDCCAVEERRWNKWSMKYLTTSEKSKEYFQYSASNEFKPYLMSTTQITRFIEKLSALQEQ